MERIAPIVFISQRIRRILETLFVFAAFFIEGTSTQSTVVTHLSAAVASLACNVTANTVSARWTEVPGAEPIYRWFNDEIRDQREPSEAKYDNFNSSKSQTSFSLIINTVGIDDGGTYQCDILSNVESEDGATDQILTVEVPGTVIITDASDVEIDALDVTVGEKYLLTCRATAARSVNDLTLTWTPATGTTIGVPNPPSDGKTSLDYSSTLQYEPQKDHSSIICTLGDFESQIPVVQVRDTVTLNVRYRPECTVEFSSDEDNCTTVTVTCNCDAEPLVDSYRFYQDDRLIQGTSGNTSTANIEMDQETNFSCEASNTIDNATEFGEKANLEESFVCNSTTAAPTTEPPTTEGTTAAPTTTAEPPPTEASTLPPKTTGPPASTLPPKTTGPPDPVPNPIVYIIVGSVCGCIVLVVFLIWWFKLRDGGGDDKRSVTATNSAMMGVTNGGGPNSNVDPDDLPPLYAEVNKERKSGKNDDSSPPANKDAEIPAYGVANNGKNDDSSPPANKDAEIPAYGVVNKPKKTADSVPAPRVSQGKMEELQYADLDLGRDPPSNTIHQPADEPTVYATVQSVIL